MARAVTTRTKIGFTVAAWIVALLIFFPILYTIITSLKTEPEAIAGFNLIPSFTFESYVGVQTQHELLQAVHELGDHRGRLDHARAHRRDPRRLGDGLLADQAHQGRADVDAVDQDDAGGRGAGADLPDLPRTGLLDTRIGLTVMLMLINLPIVIWMLYTYFREIPGEILEAARMDGASLWNEIVYVLTPMAMPGIASTLLLNIILAWNEAFWTIRLTTTNAAPLTAFIASLLQPAGPVLGQALGGLDAGHRADPDHGLVQPEAARPRPDLRRREVDPRETTMGNIVTSRRQQVLRRDQHHPEDQPRHRGRRVRRLRRPLGLRQVHAPAADRRARGHHRAARS